LFMYSVPEVKGLIETLAVTAPDIGSNVIHLPLPTKRSATVKLGAAFAAPVSSVLLPLVIDSTNTMFGADAGGETVGPKVVCVW